MEVLFVPDSKFFKSFIEDMSQFPEVEGIALAGSRTTKRDDEHSDYDVYIYLNSALDVKKRKEIMQKYCSYFEMDNRFWENEDNGRFNDGVIIDVLFRSIDDIAWQLYNALVKHEARNGYSTCLWHNILSSEILYDKTGKLQALFEKYRVDYPDELAQNIIERNRELLKGEIPSYYSQIEKAIERNDLVSINHRIAEFLASYFDIIFALNRIPHPGEKRLESACSEQCKETLPDKFVENLERLIKSIGSNNEEILKIIDEMIENLDKVLKREVTHVPSKEHRQQEHMPQIASNSRIPCQEFSQQTPAGGRILFRPHAK